MEQAPAAETPAEATTNTNIENNPAPKKSRTGLVAALIVLLLIIAGAVTALIVVNAKNTPENVVLDAVTNTIKDKNHQISGKIETTVLTPMTLAEGNYRTTVVFELDGHNDGLSNASTASITIKGFGSRDYVFRFSEVLQDDGTIYIKSAEIADFVNSLSSMYAPYLTEEPYTSTVALIKNLANKISSAWWRISIPELLGAFGVKDDSIAGQYNCFINAAKKLFDNSSLNSIADAYKNHQFLSVEKYDNNSISSFSGDVYRASIDAVRLAKFWNASMAIAPFNDMRACSAGGNDRVAEALDPVTSEQLEPMNGKKVFLDIKDRRVSGIYFASSADGNSYTADLHLDKSSDEVVAPADAKPVTELKDDVAAIINAIIGIYSALSTTNTTN